MRIKNKELRRRWHRKEQRVKQLQKELRAQFQHTTKTATSATAPAGPRPKAAPKKPIAAVETPAKKPSSVAAPVKEAATKKPAAPKKPETTETKEAPKKPKAAAASTEQ